jgi:hypothetical protein
MLRSTFFILAVALTVAGCAQDNSAIRVTNDTKAAAAVPAAQARHEPIFYNGKTYQLEFAPLEGGKYAMAVKGMNAAQEKDAIAVATSSLRYFKCPDGQTGVLASKAGYVDKQWRMTARCG